MTHLLIAADLAAIAASGHDLVKLREEAQRLADTLSHEGCKESALIASALHAHATAITTWMAKKGENQ